MRKCKYVCLRYFLVKNLLSMTTSEKHSGADAFVARVLRNFQTTLGDVDYAIRITKNKEGLYFGKLAKKSHTEKNDLTPSDVIEQELEDWPAAEFICEPLRNQIIVIRMNGRLFQTVDRLKELLSELFSKELRSFGYDVRVEPIVRENSFWELVNSSRNVYCVNLKLLSPNLFGANSSATGMLKEVHDVCNNTDIEIKVTSDDGDLKVKEVNFGSYVKYAEQGGGAWQATVGDDSGIRTVRSGQSVQESYVSQKVKESDKRLEQAYEELVEHITLPGRGS